MKLIGRRWAKIDVITAPDYIPKLNEKIPTNLQQGVNQMTYQSNPQQQQQIQQQLSNMNNGMQNNGMQQNNMQNNNMQQNGMQQNYSNQQMNNGNYQNMGAYENQQNSQYPPQYFVQPGTNYQNNQYQNNQYQNNQYSSPQAMNNQQSNNGNMNTTSSSERRSPSSRTGYTHEYLLENGQIVNTTQAYNMASQGLIDGVMCSSNKGTKYIRMVGDGNVYNNLDDLPEF